MGNSFTTTTAAVGTDSPVTYGTRAGIEGIYGTQNVAIYADLNATQDAAEIDAQIDRARQYSYDWINSKLRGAGMTAPATAGNFSEFGLLDDIEDERAGAWLYFSRGKDDENLVKGAAQMQWHWDHAEAELDRIIDVSLRASSRTGAFGGGIYVGGTATAALPVMVY